ncbi:hypothetical protein IQ07DRAFT_586470 [Pyrenochaeta sp. DS3sAY3a]|nr:hypothetical protein IQ07DRAFT_586470 [Pyrenochaeta sp. DS3sAY3a]
MRNSWILSAIALLSLLLGAAATKPVSALAAQASLYARATNKTICGSESACLIPNFDTPMLTPLQLAHPAS